MVLATNLGFPRIGGHREFKKHLEAFWSGQINDSRMLEEMAKIRRSNWLLQQQAGIDHIPSGDFSLYDHVLDTAVMAGVIPARFAAPSGAVDLKTYFAMARGGPDTPALEMTKWFDTNYHYLVPELQEGQNFVVRSDKPIREFLEARELGILTRPVLLGPVSFLLLSKAANSTFHPLGLLEHLLPVYEQVLTKLQDVGAQWIQMDEPCLAVENSAAARSAFQRAYQTLCVAAPGLKLMLTSYFGPLADNLECAVNLPVAGLHLDMTRAAHELPELISKIGPTKVLSLGLIDGRNIWRADLAAKVEPLTLAVRALGTQRVMVAPSCSLLHVPVDMNTEPRAADQPFTWMAFAHQKLHEIVALKNAVDRPAAATAAFQTAGTALAARNTAGGVVNPAVRQRAAAVTKAMTARRSRFASRKVAQQANLHLPRWPTTTIGSFPQTQDVRRARMAWRAGTMSLEEYNAFHRKQIQEAVEIQEAIGLDVLVHGESERTDMVEFFGEQLTGFLTTANGWVQSYGSRCVKPPVIFGDVQRPVAMTVDISAYAQSLTTRPMKGMLTGPVTIMQWSFVRDDLPRRDVCRQIALAIRDEVMDLEKAGIRIIQVDEPALREGLPLATEQREGYLNWATECFRLAVSGVEDATQIHTHMCYCDFNDIMPAIAGLDADVISIEAARSGMELLAAFREFRYPNDVGPGVYDIHSPEIPTVEAMANLLQMAARGVPADQLWVNPDCGLKTRRWDQVKPSLINMVAAAVEIRKQAKSDTIRSKIWTT